MRLGLGLGFISRAGSILDQATKILTGGVFWIDPAQADTVTETSGRVTQMITRWSRTKGGT